MLNIHDIAQDVSVSDDTARRWLQVLEKSDIIFYLRPYSNNLLKRTIKTPKMYFFDTGLVAYLTRYTSPEILQNGAINGAILENYVVSEIIKTYHNAAQDCLLWYYHDKDSNEIDMVIESDGQLHPLEIKCSANPGSELISMFSVLDKGSVPRGKGALICMRPEFSAINSDNYILFYRNITQFISSIAKNSATFQTKYFCLRQIIFIFQIADLPLIKCRSFQKSSIQISIPYIRPL